MFYITQDPDREMLVPTEESVASNLLKNQRSIVFPNYDQDSNEEREHEKNFTEVEYIKQHDKMMEALIYSSERLHKCRAGSNPRVKGVGSGPLVNAEGQQVYSQSSGGSAQRQSFSYKMD